MRMSSDDEDLRLNTLHRFEKRSPRLTLQIYSHCEVPAGCGGVVLRWTNPASAFGALLHVAPGDGIEAWMDGSPFATTRLNLAYGDHLLALRVVPVPVEGKKTKGLLRLFAGPAIARPFACALASDAPAGDAPAPAAVATSASGWRCSTAAPSGWTEPAFDDAGWQALPACPLDLEQFPTNLAWKFRRLVDSGARLLDLPDAPEVFVRHRFRISR